MAKQKRHIGMTTKDIKKAVETTKTTILRKEEFMRNKNFKTVLAKIMVFALVVNMLLPQTSIFAEVSNEFAGGDGTVHSPYQIATAGQLQNLSSLVNDNATSELYQGAYYELTDDIDMSGVTDWAPIGTSEGGSKEFTGNFNGNNHVINSLTADVTINSGVFGTIKGATIKNLGVVDCVITADSNVGGIAGVIKSSDTVTIIENCYVNGSIMARVSCAGGIAGLITSSDKNDDSIIIKNCYSMGYVEASSGNVGGISGTINDVAGNLNVDVSYCYSTAYVSGDNYVAGIVANVVTSGSAITIKNCMALNDSIEVTTTTATGSAIRYGRILSDKHVPIPMLSSDGESSQVFFNGNRGLQTISTYIPGFTSWTNDDTDSDGAVVRKLEVNSATFWTDTANWYENGWSGFTFENEKLPGFGAAVELPRHLQLSSDFTPPTVINVSPANGQTGVKIAGDIVITFSEAMDDSIDGKVTLNGVPVLPVDTEWIDTDGDGDKETYRIGYEDLAKSTEFNIVISEFVDAEGNLMYPNSDYSFYSVSGSDSVLPTVKSVSPINDQTNVPVNGDIVITFSEAMNTSVGTILLNGVTLNKTNASWSKDGTVYTIPYVNLNNNANYKITISAFKDLAGNVMVDNTDINFVSATIGADIIKPTVKKVTPENGATNVSVGTDMDISLVDTQEISYIEINFSELMDTTVIGTVKLNGVTLDKTHGMFGLISDNGITYHIHYSDLTPNTKYTITIEDFKDKAGNKMASDSTYSFTTAAIGADTVKPTIKKVTPNNETPVASNGLITVKFSEEMDTTVGDIYLGGIILNEVGTWSLDKTTYSIAYKNLTAGNTYNIIVKNFKDKAGNVLESLTPTPTPTTYVFSVAEQGAPIVLDVQIDKTVDETGSIPDTTFDSTNGVITITFNEAIIPTGDVLLNGIKIPEANIVGQANTCVYKIGYKDLLSDTTYNITICNFSEVVPPLATMALNNEYSFTTSNDKDKPVISLITPSDDEKGVSTNGEIVINFNEVMDTSFAGKVMIKDPIKGGNTQLNNGVWSNEGKVYTVSYSGLLESNSYGVEVSDFRDISGNVMDTHTMSFSTSSASDLIKPTITNIIPANGATGVEIEDGYLQITFSEKMSAYVGTTPNVYDQYSGKIILNNVTLPRTDDATTVTDSFGWETEELLTYRIPLPKLAYDTTYTVIIKDFKDENGNKMEAITYTFKTVSEIDNLKPTVASMTPEKDSTNAPISGNIVINFSEEMDMSILGKVALNGNNLDLTTGTWDNNNTTFIVSYPELQNEKTYEINVADFKDLAGNTMTSTKDDLLIGTYEFTTVKAGYDIYKPTVTLVIPKENAEGVAIKGSIRIIFSEKMNDTSGVGKVYLNGTALSGTSGWSGNNSVYEIEYSGLTKDKVYNVSLQGFKDVAGNTMDNYGYKFTAISQDTIKPFVISTIPANNGEDVAVAGDLVINFSEGMRTVDENEAPIGVVSWKDGFEIQGGVWSNGNSTLTIPYEVLSGREYTIVVDGFKDKAGNVMDSAYEFTFDTESLLVESLEFSSKSETLVSGDINYATKGGFEIVFTDAMKSDVGSVKVTELPITIESDFIELTGVWSNDFKTYTVTYDELNNDTSYGIILENFEDENSNKMKQYKDVFTIAAKPVISNVTPLDDAVEIPIAGNVVVTFDKEMDKTTKGTVKVGDATLNSANATWSADGKVYTIAYSSLSNNTDYTVTVDGFKDTLGSAADLNSDNSFTTAPKPLVTSVTPLNNANGIAILGNIVVVFDRDMNTATAGTVKLGTITLNAANGTWSVDGRTYTIAYASMLNSTNYTITVDGFKDSIGSTMDKNNANSFTTAAKPVVSSVTPSNNATNVAVSGNVSVTFDKAMDKTTIGTVKLGTTTLDSANGSWSLDGRTYSIAYSNIAYNTAHTVSIEGFKDSIGSTMDKNNANSFTTLAKPVVSTVRPAHNTTSVSTSGNVIVTFDKIMDKTTIGTISLGTTALDATSGSWSEDGRTYTIAYSNLTNSKLYVISIEGFKDSFGSLMDKNNANSFTTVASYSSSGVVSSGGGSSSGGSSSNTDVVIVDNTYYVVTFNNNYDGSQEDTQTVLSNNLVVKPSNPTRTGYVFGGWYTEQTCKNAYNFNAQVTDAITLYAKWSVKTNTPTVDKKAGTYVNSVKVTLTCTTKDAKIYYTLDGTKPTTASKYVLSGKTVTISKTQTLRFMANANGNSSSEGTKTKYTIKTAAITTTAVPKNSTGAKDRKITLTAPANTTLYYVVGTTSADKTAAPTTKSLSVKAGKTAQITITKDTYVKVMAVKSGCSKSDMITRTYKVK